MALSPSSGDGARPRFAAIDVGTNSVRLVVAEVEPDGNYRVLDEEPLMTRLGRGFYRTGRLGRAPMERTIEAICKMKAIADGFAVRELRVVATAAVREASNRRAFKDEVRRRCGVNLEVISAEEEAQLAFKSVNRHFALDQSSMAVVDIGGGSVEVVLAADGVVNQVYSLPLGAVRLTERYVKSDPLSRKHWKKLRRAIDEVIDEKIGEPPFSAELMIGSGGTFTNLGEMVQCEREGRFGPIRGYVLSRADLVRLLDRLLETPLGARRQLCALNPKRADIIVAGTAAVARLAKHLGTQRILVNDRGIRDGLLICMIEEAGCDGAAGALPVSDRMTWVREFAVKCHSNVRHCEQVARLAVQLFDALAEPFEIPPSGRDVLEAAALLHDVGYLINHAKHHKHAYHLIMHGDLSGFSPGEVELIANVARYHRRAAPRKSHENFRRLEKADQRLVRQLAGILRVAEGLDRTHGQGAEGLRVQVDERVVHVLVAAGANPQVDIADAERKGGLLAQTLGIELVFEWSKRPGRQATRPAEPRFERAATAG